MQSGITNLVPFSSHDKWGIDVIKMGKITLAIQFSYKFL